MTHIQEPSRTTESHAGIGLRAPHVHDVATSRPAIGFYEIHAENYMAGGPTLARLQRIRSARPVSVHGVGLSLGSAGGIDGRHLDRLTALIAAVEPFVVSEHLTWSAAGGMYLNDLVPLPYTSEALETVITNIDRVQTRLKRQILIENPSLYVRYKDSPITEPEFLAALVSRTGCGILCDVNNIYVSTQNLGGDPIAWLDALPAEAIGEIHLAGHTVNDADGVAIHIDDHGSAVTDAVWRLYEHAVRRFPKAPTLIEWDSRIPALDVLLDEAAKADAVRARALARGPLSNAVAA
ncbi:MAG: DUF692 domain-containing protein [Hyphomicrobiales bacterium]|nr:DUF692 domain-containing protein [Hyphomicrobiales bacterium]